MFPIITESKYSALELMKDLFFPSDTIPCTQEDPYPLPLTHLSLGTDHLVHCPFDNEDLLYKLIRYTKNYCIKEIDETINYKKISGPLKLSYLLVKVN